jgi:hypothetical protein
MDRKAEGRSREAETAQGREVTQVRKKIGKVITMFLCHKQRLFLLVGLIFIHEPRQGLCQDQFPVAPYSGMQLNYALTGADVTDSIDSQDVTRVRTIRGKVSGEELQIRGEFVCRSPEKSELRVELWVDEQKSEIRFPDVKASAKLTSPQSFELKIPVPLNAKKAGLTIVASAATALGAREIHVRGEFDVATAKRTQTSPVITGERVVVGNVTEQIHGDIQSRADEHSPWKSVAAGEPLFVGSRIRTVSEGSAVLRLANDDELYLDRDSEVLLRANGVVLDRGSLKLTCSQEQSPRLIVTDEFVTEFTGQHLGLDYLDSRTTVSNIDGIATMTLQANSTKGVKIHAGIRAEGDATGLAQIESIDLAHEDSRWQQLGLSPIIVPPTESIAKGESHPHETPANVVTPPTPDMSINAGKLIPIELPSDPNIRIIVLDSTGGYTPQRKSNEPELVIYADGRAVITDPFGRHPKVIRRLSHENVKEFLNFVVNEHHFYDLSTEGLGDLIKQIKAQGGVPEITDMPTAIIRIGIQNKTYEVRCPAPDYFASQLPEVEPFQHYEAIYKRLTTFITASREWAEKQKR